MRVGPIIVGASIGWLVWVLALRTTGAATRDSTPGQGGAPPPTATPGSTMVTDGQGNVVGTPLAAAGTGDAAAPDATTTGLIVAADSAPNQTVVGFQSENNVIGIDGNTGSSQPMKVDPVSATVKPDDNAPLGGQGVDQMAASAGTKPPPQPPSYAAGAATDYSDYLRARYGTTDGMTPQQIDQAMMEAAKIGGLPL